MIMYLSSVETLVWWGILELISSFLKPIDLNQYITNCTNVLTLSETKFPYYTGTCSIFYNNGSIRWKIFLKKLVQITIILYCFKDLLYDLTLLYQVQNCLIVAFSSKLIQVILLLWVATMVVWF